MLDAWALLAMLRGEAAASRVRAVIASAHAVASSVNVGEVLYWAMRDRGRGRATSLVDEIRTIVQVEDPDWPLVREAAEIKARGGLSYADAFCVATARRHRAPLYTGDREILERVDHGLEVVNLRSSS